MKGTSISASGFGHALDHVRYTYISPHPLMSLTHILGMLLTAAKETYTIDGFETRQT